MKLQGRVSPPKLGGVAVRQGKRCDSHLSPHRRGGSQSVTSQAELIWTSCSSGTTPSAPAKDADAKSLWVAATPPNLGGDTPKLRHRQIVHTLNRKPVLGSAIRSFLIWTDVPGQEG